MAVRRLIIVTGKGGTGRSAVTAAMALRYAALGDQVLAISMSPSPGLAVHLGATELGYEATEMSPGLSALTVDRRHALDEYVHAALRLPRRAPLGGVSMALNGVADTVPGIRDVITIGKVAFEAWTDRWDTIVADGPPTGQIGSYLRAPAVIAKLVPAGLVQRQADAMADLLSEDSTTVVVTTLAEELPVTETLEAVADLEESGFAPQIIVNRMVSDLDYSPDGDGPAAEAAELHLSMWESQQRWRSQLPDGVELPFLFGIHTPTEVAARLADELGEGFAQRWPR